MNSFSLEKLRIFAMLYRLQEITPEEKPKQIIIVECGRGFGRTEAIKRYKNQIFKDEAKDLFSPPLEYPTQEDKSKYFGKPKNNFKK